MIVLLGASGYVGQAFAEELQLRQWQFAALSRKEVDYTRFEILLEFLRRTQPSFLINAAGYTGKPNVDACETAQAETLAGNTLFPQNVAHACMVTGVPWGHVSSGCIYSGAKVMAGGTIEVQKDLMQPAVRELIERMPECVQGYTENDAPNFSFRSPPCSFYSGTKALAEEAIAGVGQCYLWRLRIPFDQFDNSRNYLTKVQRYQKIYNNFNSLSHRGDFARACLDLWERRASFGIYNVTNPGFVSTAQVVGIMERILKPSRRFEYWADDEEFYRLGARTPRSNCILDTGKLLSTGVHLRPVQEAVEDSIRNWRTQ